MREMVADQFAEFLVAAEVKRVYGIAGDSLNGLTDAMRRQGEIEWLHVRHEKAAAFAAGTEAPLTRYMIQIVNSSPRPSLKLLKRAYWPSAIGANQHAHTFRETRLDLRIDVRLHLRS